MKKLNGALAVSVLALFLLSFLSWRESVVRAQRFERGQKFLPNLNPDEIAEIEIKKGETKTQLRRSRVDPTAGEAAKDHFVVASADGYPAKNEAINRLIQGVLGIALEKKIGTSAALDRDLGLEADGAETLELTLKDAGGQTMVQFRVGQTQDGSGTGSYVRRTDRPEDPVYLTSSRVYLASGDDEFLQDEIVDVKQDQITAIRGADFDLVERGDNLELEGLPAGKKLDSSKLSQLRSLLSYLRFEKHHLADAPELQGLAFGDPIQLELEDQSGYQLRVAEQGGKHYLQIRGFMAVKQVAVGPDDSDEKNAANAEVLARADAIQGFNELHGSWIYEVSEAVAEKIEMRKRQLLEGG
ncbi:MAG: DUF4340 domain-containing protein [Thermoanaerobaculia bacterium]|nr:DUF4340 domain-containing protein [Thermoanaerobaculia bacterium]